MNEHIAERDFADQVYELAQFRGWLIYRTYDSRRSPAGYPDLSMVRGNRHIFAEIKTEEGKTSPEQQEWLLALAEAGHEVFVWRPSYWWQVVLATERSIA